MKENKSLSLKNPTILFLSFFGTGFAKFAPGTVGTIATLPFLYLFSLADVDLKYFITGLIILTVISCILTDRLQKKLNLHDPQWIVMDEVLGMATTWCFSQSYELHHLLIQFILFRFFDIFKVWPANYFDKDVKHGSGTILDDIVSGILAGSVYFVLAITRVI